MQKTHEIDMNNCLPRVTTFTPWIICFAASLFFFYEFIQGNMFASIADEIMRDFHIEANKMTYLSSVYYLSNVLFLFVAGVTLDRLSPKKTLMMAMFLCVLSTFVLAGAHNFYLALLCRFVTGIGSAFCFLGPIRIASHWFPPKRMALVTGSIVTMAMSGGLLSQYPLTKLVLWVGWRESLIWIAWLGVGMLIVMAIVIKDKIVVQTSSKSRAVWSTAKKAYLNSQTWRAAFYTSLMNMAVAVFGAVMGQLYLMQKLGVTQAEASVVNSMLFLGSILGGPMIGWLSDRLRMRVLPMKAGVLISFFITLMILYTTVSLIGMGILFFLLGFFTAAQVISYAQVAESNAPSMTAMAVSTVSISTQGGYVLYQNLFSAFLSHHGGMHLVDGLPVYSLADYQSAAIILPLGLIIALLTMVGLKETHCRQNLG